MYESNKINHDVKSYPSPKKATENLSFKNLNKINTLQRNCTKTQSVRLAKLLEPELSCAHLNNVNCSFDNAQEGRVTAVVAKAKYQKATENQAMQRVEHSARCHPSNEVIQVLLDSRSDGDLMFHKKGTPMPFPYLTRQVPNSWHMSNGSFLTKGRSDVSLKIFEYSNSKKFLVTPDIVEYDKKNDKANV